MLCGCQRVMPCHVLWGALCQGSTELQAALGPLPPKSSPKTMGLRGF